MKRNLFLVVLSSLLLSIGWPTYGQPIALFIALVPLLQLIEEIKVTTSKRKGLKIGAYAFLLFFIWNTATVWWVSNATLFGGIFTLVFNSFVYTIAIMFYYWMSKRMSKNGTILYFISLWICLEKFHLTWGFSWPWLNLGNAFSEHIYWIQWYEYTGTFGGTLWILIINFSFWKIYRAYLKDKSVNKALRKGVLPLLGIAIPIVISLIIYSNEKTEGETVEVVLIQPNIDPYSEKFEMTNIDFFKGIEELTKEYLSEGTDYLLTPETYFTEGSGFNIDSFKTATTYSLLKNYQSYFPNLNLVLGTQFYKLFNSPKAPNHSAIKIRENVWVDLYNSAFQLNSKDSIQLYHKSKLVPGVESIPYKKYLNPILGELMIDLGGTVASLAIQKNRTVFFHQEKSFGVAPIICYESIYGEYVTEYTKKGATFFGVMSNDAWWGNTQGHKQLLSYSRLRAIENRRAIARSANTGISAFINSKGEIEKWLPYGEKGTLKSRVVQSNKLTFYTQFGDYIARISFFFFSFLSLIYSRKTF